MRLPPPRRVRGHEQQGARYGVVLQADDLAKLSTVVVAPTSRGAQPASFRPEVEILGERTRVLVEQIRTVDAERLGAAIGNLLTEELQRVDEALCLVLGISR